MEEIDCYYYTEDEKRQNTIDRFKAAGWKHCGPGLCFSRAPQRRKYYPEKVTGHLSGHLDRRQSSKPNLFQRFQSSLKRTFKRTLW